MVSLITYYKGLKYDSLAYISKGQKMIIKQLGLSIVFIVTFTLSGVVYSAPAGENQLRLFTGLSKRTGETAFSYLVSWQKEGAMQRQINGLTFINGSSSRSPTSAVEVAHKITKAINAAVIYQSPRDRGAIAKNNKSEVIVSNHSGFDLTQITVRDYSNQALQYSIPEKSFKAAATDIAIDIVYSAAVEYIAGFSTGVKQKTAGGFVTVTIDNNLPIKIKTDGKSIKQIETELADAIGTNAHFSSTPVYPNFVQLRSKNYKSFDGGEVQLPALNARSIIVDVNDSGLGVLTKFHFTGVKQSADVVNNIPYIIGFLFAGIFGYLFFYKKAAGSNR